MYKHPQRLSVAIFTFLIVLVFPIPSFSQVQQPTAGNKSDLIEDAGDVGKLSLDELKARRGEQVYELSLRDSKILSLLAANKGKVVDRDTLFNHCWGRDYLPNSRTLDQHISKLRKLIEIDHKHPVIIKTVHGAGYRFDD